MVRPLCHASRAAPPTATSPPLFWSPPARALTRAPPAARSRAAAAREPAAPRLPAHARAAFTPRRHVSMVPKLVWLFWLQGWASAPWLAQQVVASWRFYNPDWEVRLLDANNYSAAVDVPYLMRDAIATPAKSDILRVSLLAAHGGVWADASMLCLAPLDGWIHAATSPGGLFMYHSHVSTAPCSWFIAAEKDSAVMRAWRNATDAFWGKQVSSEYPYFWMDQLFMQLLSTDADVAAAWARVPFSDCTAPNGAPATLHGRHGLPIDAPLLKVFETAPPNTVKLSVHGSPLTLNASEERALPNTTSYVAIWFSRVMRDAIPVGTATLAQVQAGGGAANADVAPAAAAVSEAAAATVASPPPPRPPPPAAAASASSATSSATSSGALSASAAAALAAFGAAVRAGGVAGSLAAGACDLHVYGSQYGGHALCAPKNHTNSRCFYINYGIEQDYSFDTQLSSELGCFGVALDPTVTHRSELVPNVFFLKMGAPSVGPVPDDWQVLHPARLWDWHGRRPVYALKYDCEGCEYALAPSDDAATLAAARALFGHVHQLNVELHLHTFILDSVEKLANLAQLLQLLDEAGMRLVHVGGAGCGRDKEGVRSCRDEVYAAGLPCEGADCSSFLFAKV